MNPAPSTRQFHTFLQGVNDFVPVAFPESSCCLPEALGCYAKLLSLLNNPRQGGGSPHFPPFVKHCAAPCPPLAPSVVTSCVEIATPLEDLSGSHSQPGHQATDGQLSWGWPQHSGPSGSQPPAGLPVLQSKPVVTAGAGAHQTSHTSQVQL